MVKPLDRSAVDDALLQLAILARPSSDFDLDEANAHRYSSSEKRDVALAADKAEASKAPKRVARAGAH